MPTDAGGGHAPGRAGAGRDRPAATPRFPLGGREGEKPPNGGFGGDLTTAAGAQRPPHVFPNSAQAEPPPMIDGG